MLLEIKPNEYINTRHVILLKILSYPEKPRVLVVEFINGVIVKYPETSDTRFEDLLNRIRKEVLT